MSKDRTMRRAQAGLTLMELMVALALGGFLVLGVVNVFMTTRESANVEAALSRVQESGRFAMDVLAKDLRGAHYTGCNSVNRAPDILIRNMNYTGARGFRRSGGAWVGGSDHTPDANDPGQEGIATDPDRVRDGTDVLSVHVAQTVGSNLLTADVQPTSVSMNLGSNPGCALEDEDGLGQAVILSSCLTAHVFMADVSPASCTDPNSPVTLTLNADNDFGDGFGPGYAYTADSEVLSFESVVWYVGDTGRDRNGIDVYALYRESSSEPRQEMVEGVEYMQLFYGQRGGTPEVPSTRFVPAGDADLEWGEVVSVRIGLLVQNFDPVREVDDARSYVLADPNGPIDPNSHGGGRVLRHAFRSTVALRNTNYDL